MMKSILSLFLLTTVIYSADLSRDNDGIITDISTNLEWQDNVSNIENNWDKAINYCEDLSLGGHNDWRLPNRNELISIVDYSKYNPAIEENIFKNITANYYWSSSSYANNYSNAWIISFSNGSNGYDHKTYNNYVRCVRGGQ